MSRLLIHSTLRQVCHREGGALPVPLLSMQFAETKPMMLTAYGQPEKGSFTLFANKVKDKAQWNSSILRRAGGTAAEEETRKDPRSHLCPYVPFL